MISPTLVCVIFVAAAVVLGLILRYNVIFAQQGTIDDNIPRIDVKSAKPDCKPSYSGMFPPPRRQILVSGLYTGERKTFNQADNVTGLSWSRDILQIDESYQAASRSRYIYSGFSIGDIEDLGNFPDYSTLSGVPLPSPVRNFDIKTALPRPYRPFRWPYFQTMSLSKMDTDYWLELENTYTARIKQRQQLWATESKAVLHELPGSELACKELSEMVIQFLTARYPKQFTLDGTILVNHILGTRSDLASTSALEVLLNHVPEDFAIMLRDPRTGYYILRAGIICSAIGWTLAEKMGKGLSEIHGLVPDYKSKMELSMERFFGKMKTDSPIQRGSWGFEMGQPLYVPPDHPEYGHRKKQNPNLTPEHVHLRVDWQTLRRLPLSGAIVFNFKALFTPLTDLRYEPKIPSLVLKVLEDGNKDIIKYKGVWHVEHVVKPTLKGYERQQVEDGILEKEWVVRTLDEYPFFPGWSV